MAEYIDREELLTHQYNASHSNWPQLAEMVVGVEDIEDAPAADVAPVVYGRWADSGRYTFPSGNTSVRCTNCGCALTESEYRLNNWNYCPVCGAKMDGGDGDAAD